MKKVFLTVFIFAFIFCTGFSAQENAEDKSPHSFGIVTDLTLRPLAPQKASKEEHFSAPSEFYEGMEFRVTGQYAYTVPVPFSDNPLFGLNRVSFCGEMELTPVTLAPRLSITFCPIAFLEFSASAKIGTGWDFIGNQGIAVYNDRSGKYDSLNTFENWYYQFEFNTLFQFDLAAVLPGDWHHVVMQANYDLIYSGLTGVADGTPFDWQVTYEKANGLNYYANLFVGYQMPLVLQTVGIMTEWSGYYSNDVFDKKYEDFFGAFTFVSINPAAILKFDDHNSLTVALYFSTRRGYDAEKRTINGRKQSELDMKYSAPEWYFQRIAFRWEYKF